MKKDNGFNYGQMVLDAVKELNGAGHISLKQIQNEAKEFLGSEFNAREVAELIRLFNEQGVYVITFDMQEKIQPVLDAKAKEDNTIDLNAYALGVADGYLRAVKNYEISLHIS